MAVQDFLADISDRFGWRFDKLRRAIASRLWPDAPEWTRLVMNRETARLVSELPFRDLHAIEISGEKWREFGFASYQFLNYPEYDLCNGPLQDQCCDIILLEQVLEHVLWPYRALRSIFGMLRPGGYVLVTTPFLVKVHNAPMDCSRWTELGLKHLLAEVGFPLSDTITGSWGNRVCIRKTLRSVPGVIHWWHTVQNEPNYPVVVWALGRKPGPPHGSKG